MQIVYLYTPTGNHEEFKSSVLSFDPSTYHDLWVFSSHGSRPDAEAFFVELEGCFRSVTIIGHSINDPMGNDEYAKFESRIMSGSYTRVGIGPTLFLCRNEVPTANGWADTIESFIHSHNKPLIGYAFIKDGGIYFPGSLLTNNYYNTFTTSKFYSPTESFRDRQRYEAIGSSTVLFGDVIPLSGKSFDDAKAEVSELVSSREKLVKSTTAKAAAVAKRNADARNYKLRAENRKTAPSIRPVEPTPDAKHIRSITTPTEAVLLPPAVMPNVPVQSYSTPQSATGRSGSTPQIAAASEHVRSLDPGLDASMFQERPAPVVEVTPTVGTVPIADKSSVIKTPAKKAAKKAAKKTAKKTPKSIGK